MVHPSIISNPLYLTSIGFLIYSVENSFDFTILQNKTFALNGWVLSLLQFLFLGLLSTLFFNSKDFQAHIKKIKQSPVLRNLLFLSSLSISYSFCLKSPIFLDGHHNFFMLLPLSSILYGLVYFLMLPRLPPDFRLPIASFCLLLFGYCYFSLNLFLDFRSQLNLVSTVQPLVYMFVLPVGYVAIGSLVYYLPHSTSTKELEISGSSVFIFLIASISSLILFLSISIFTPSSFGYAYKRLFKTSLSASSVFIFCTIKASKFLFSFYSLKRFGVFNTLLLNGGGAVTSYFIFGEHSFPHIGHSAQIFFCVVWAISFYLFVASLGSGNDSYQTYFDRINIKISPRISRFYGLVIFIVLILTLLLSYNTTSELRDNNKYIFKAETDIDISHHPRICASLSTTPMRISLIEPAIVAIKNQSLKPDVIYLNVPYWSRKENKSYTLPTWLKRHPDVVVLRGEDYGPSTKIVPSVLNEDDPETIIISFDDDRAYHPDIIKILVKWGMRHPTSAIGFIGWTSCLRDPPPNCTRVSAKGNNWPGLENFTPRPVDVLSGYGSILYRVGFFDKSLLVRVFEFGTGCILGDDYWLSANLAMNGVPRHLIPKFDRPPWLFRTLDHQYDEGALHASGNVPNYVNCGSQIEKYFPLLFEHTLVYPHSVKLPQ